MKKLVFGLIATVLFAFNGNAQEKLTQEEVRVQLATSMSQLVNQCKSSYKEDMSYDEFINATFEGNKISTVEGQDLMKSVYEFLSKGVNSEDIIKNYDGKEMASVLLIAGNTCSKANAVAAVFGNNIANSPMGQELSSSRCGWFSWLCDAAAWIWEHRKEILELLTLIENIHI